MDYPCNEEIRKAFETVREFCKGCETCSKSNRERGCPVINLSCGDFPNFWVFKGEDDDYND